MITALTSEQRIRLAEMHAEWLAGLQSSEPLDRERASALLADLYHRIRKPPPRVLIFSSPAMCLLAWAALTTRREHCDHLREALAPPLRKLWDQLPAQIEAEISGEGERRQLEQDLGIGLAESLRHLKQQLPHALEEHARRQIAPALWNQLDRNLLYRTRGARLFDEQGRVWRWAAEPEWNIWDHPWKRPIDGGVVDRLRRELIDQLADQGYLLRACLGNVFCHDSYSLWETFYQFLGEIGVEYSPEQTRLLDLHYWCARSLHWWFPYNNVVLAAERHSPPSLDREGRLHAADGLACQYADGWGVAAWSGIVIPARYAQPTAREILDEPNAELRRVLMERYDHVHEKGSFLVDAGPRVLDSAIQRMRPGLPEAVAELLAIELAGDPERRMVMLHVICPSTERSYWIRVPPNQTRVRAALAWTFDLPAEEYELDQET